MIDHTSNFASSVTGVGFQGPREYGEQPRLGGVIVSLCKARLEWLGGCKRHLLGEFRELLGLLGDRLKLISSMVS